METAEQQMISLRMDSHVEYISSIDWATLNPLQNLHVLHECGFATDLKQISLSIWQQK